jgi:hypothetical protein
MRRNVMMTIFKNVTLLWLVPLIFAMVLLMPNMGKTIELKHPIHPVSYSETPKPGLAVWFRDGKWRHMENLPQKEAFVESGRAGGSIASVNFKSERGEAILDSGRNTQVGALIRGMILLEIPGEYAFQALSNDGVEIGIGDAVLIEDPDVHSDRLSPVATMDVVEPGWYSLDIRYFQRKGTAALHLSWKPPGAPDFEIIPSGVLAHE